MKRKMNIWKDHSDKELVNLTEVYKLPVAKMVSGFLSNRSEVEIALTEFEEKYFKKKC